ncbi:30S ribosomal S6 [Chlorella sorokiniana]|uniref:30S ribosomal S6 n=1 Tax=Chlorella sorokiniana TaxID=3076 RepID=A0A2P6TJT5_CHLSO|nr:30S ribosomal S6 [Chlorella sorokiniana]|eukprot:PRW44352.1 30S ribosomal S6 [Chlorella sorokiniana]
MLGLSTCLPRCFTPQGSRPSGRASGPSPASPARPGQPAPCPRAAAGPLRATGAKGEPEAHVDKRSGDPEHGGLTSGEKAAITREVHGEGQVHFTEEHPELKKAAEAYRKEVIKDEKQGVQHGGGHTSSSNASQAAAATPTAAGERHAKEGHHCAKEGHHCGKEGSGGKASRHAVELSPGEKAASSRYLHEGREVRTLPFVRAHLEKVAAVEAYAKEPACASSKHTAAAARQQAACLAAPRLSSGARRAFVAGSSSRAVQRSSSVVVKAAAAEAATGVRNYETMIVLRPTMADEERDQELAKFQAFLQKQGATQLSDMVRGRQRLAYPIKRFTEGIYVLYTYTASPVCGQAVQRYLSTPTAGNEVNILRHMTFQGASA